MMVAMKMEVCLQRSSADGMDKYLYFCDEDKVIILIANENLLLFRP